MKLKTGLLVAGLAAFAGASSAHGVIFNETAMVDIGNGIHSTNQFVDDPPLINQVALGFGNSGRAYQNTFDVGADGDPFNASGGSTVRTVTVANYLLGVRRLPGGNGVLDGSPPAGDDALFGHNGIRWDNPATAGVVEVIPVTLISGIELVTTSFDAGTGVAVGTVTRGRVGIFINDTGVPINTDDPSTWDVSGAPGAIDALALGVFNLASPGTITSGLFGENVGTLAQADTNVSASNLALGQSAQGIFVFEEDESVTDLFTNNNLPTNAIGDGLVVFTAQEQQTATAHTIWDGVDEAILNEIMQWSIGDDFSNFSGLLGDFEDYDPDTPIGVGGQALLDAQNTVDINANPTIRRFAVPEPVSASLAMMGLGALGMATRRRQTA